MSLSWRRILKVLYASWYRVAFARAFRGARGRAARDAFSFFAPAVHINIGLARARGCGVVV